MFAFVVIFAVVGGYALYNGFAAQPTVAHLQAEQMTLPQSSVINDSHASGGEAVRLTSNGTLKGTVTLPTNTSATAITVVAHGNKCNGYASMSVSVDRKVLIRSTPMTGSNWNSYSAKAAVSSGTHTVYITGSNIESE